MVVERLYSSNWQNHRQAATCAERGAVFLMFEMAKQGMQEQSSEIEQCQVAEEMAEEIKQEDVAKRRPRESSCHRKDAMTTDGGTLSFMGPFKHPM